MNRAALFKQVRKSSQRLEGFARSSRKYPEVCAELQEISERLAILSSRIKNGATTEPPSRAPGFEGEGAVIDEEAVADLLSEPPAEYEGPDEIEEYKAQRDIEDGDKE